MAVMLDSGAYSVWKSNKTINLQEYIDFCKKCQNTRVFVNLDVIPKSPKECNKAAEEGFRNYKGMLKHLPQDKILPVFHRSEDEKWLKKYLDTGSTHIGLGGIAFDKDSLRLDWIKKMKGLLTNGKGKPIVKVHGFATTSMDLLKSFPWHSVDSTTWAKHAHVWQILIPMKTFGKDDYTKTPLAVKLSPRANGPMCFSNLTPTARARVIEHVESFGLSIGELKLVDVREGHKIVRGQYWLNKDKRKIVQTIKDGVSTNSSLRMLVNGRFFQRAAKSLGIEYFHLSAPSPECDWITNKDDILLSFHDPVRRFVKWL